MDTKQTSTKIEPVFNIPTLSDLGIDKKISTSTKREPVDNIPTLARYKRHLNETQRAVVANKIANMRQGRRTDIQPSANLPEVNQPEAAISRHR